jgi:hypothetical protein
MLEYMTSQRGIGKQAVDEDTQHASIDLQQRGALAQPPLEGRSTVARLQKHGASRPALPKRKPRTQQKILCGVSGSVRSSPAKTGRAGLTDLGRGSIISYHPAVFAASESAELFRDLGVSKVALDYSMNVAVLDKVSTLCDDNTVNGDD